MCWSCHNKTIIAKPWCVSDNNADSYPSVCPVATKFPSPTSNMEMLYCISLAVSRLCLSIRLVIKMLSNAENATNLLL